MGEKTTATASGRLESDHNVIGSLLEFICVHNEYEYVLFLSVWNFTILQLILNFLECDFNHLNSLNT